jgi:hypothetical protein
VELEGIESMIQCRSRRCFEYSKAGSLRWVESKNDGMEG